MAASLRLIDRFHPRRTREQQAAIDAGQIVLLTQVELLSPSRMRPLALLSLGLFCAALPCFVLLDILSWRWHGAAGWPDLLAAGERWQLLLLVPVNLGSYGLVVPLHELVHGLAFRLWGGQPHYGALLPLAFYCGARNQLFRRNHYLVVCLAPLVLISLAASVVTLLFPLAAPYLLLAAVGNVSGAAGDLTAAYLILQHPRQIWVEDTEQGFRLWEIAPAFQARLASPPLVGW